MKAVFIDRDGTVGGGDDVTFPRDFVPYPFSLNAIQILKEHGYLVIAFTNQPDIARGKASLQDFEDELLGFGFDDVCICPHKPEDNCKCRKPSTYMIEQMITKHHLDISECFVIGDRWSDMLAGMNAGAKAILVKTGAGQDALTVHADKWDAAKADYIANNLSDAVQRIIQS